MAEENKPVSNSAGAPDPLRRRRRGSRGGRGRSRRPAPNPAHSEGAAPPDKEELEPAEGADFVAEPETKTAVPAEAQRDSKVDAVASVEAAPVTEERAPRPAPSRPPAQRTQDYRPQREPRPQRPPPPPPPPEPEPRRPGSAVAHAVEDVYNIVETLKKVMEELDELLETLELAERQKIEDERELDNLRRAMKQLSPRPAQVQSRVPQREREPSRHQPYPQDRPSRSAQPPRPARDEEVRERSPADAEEPPQT